MRLRAIDTHKAVKILIEAGAAEALAEAIVNTSGSIPFEDLATKADLKGFATKADLKDFVTKAHFDAVVANLATKADLKDFATKADLKDFATKADLKGFATKADLKGFATKADLENLRKEFKSDMKILEQRLIIRLGAMMFAAVGILVTLQKIL